MHPSKKAYETIFTHDCAEKVGGLMSEYLLVICAIFGRMEGEARRCVSCGPAGWGKVSLLLKFLDIRSRISIRGCVHLSVFHTQVEFLRWDFQIAFETALVT